MFYNFDSILDSNEAALSDLVSRQEEAERHLADALALSKVGEVPRLYLNLARTEAQDAARALEQARAELAAE